MLARETNRAWQLVHAARYDELAGQLADLIGRLEARMGPPLVVRRGRSLGLVSEAHQVAAALLAKVGDGMASWVAAERAVAAADRTGQHRLMIAARYRLAHALVTAGERDGAVAVVAAVVEAAGEVPCADDDNELGQWSLTAGDSPCSNLDVGDTAGLHNHRVKLLRGI